MGAVQTKIKQAKLKNKEQQIQGKTSSISSISSTSSKSSAKFPSTNDDIDLLHQSHFIMKSIWESNFSSPINGVLNDGGARILDVLCGAGTFLLESSNEHPTSEFVGIDKNKFLPSEIKPNNLKFVNGNILDGLPFEENYYDFVRLNISEPIYTLNDWKFIVKELIRVTKPGGYVEIQGLDTPVEIYGPKHAQFLAYFMILFEINGSDLSPRSHIKSLFSTNLETSYLEDRLIALGEKGGKSGILLEQQLAMFFKDSINEELAQVMNISMNDYEQKYDEVLSESDITLRSYRIWGMKKDNILSN